MKFNIDNVRSSLGALVKVDSSLLETHPIIDYIGLLDMYPVIYDYSYVSSDVLTLVEGVECLGEDILANYHKILLLKIMCIKYEYYLSRVDAGREYLFSNLQRIYISVICFDSDNSDFLYSSDKFKKNLSICLNHLQPFGAQKVCFSSIPRGFLFKNNLSQLFRGSFFSLMKTNGFKPVYEMHTDSNDPDLLELFTSDGWLLFYKDICKSLIENRKIKAIYGTSWFFDPNLKKISPRLSYLLDLPLAHGAELFYIGPSESARKSALATSSKRLSMFSSGEYQPTDYMVVWARKDILKWFKNLNEMELINVK
jgi:hypothetical protein